MKLIGLILSPILILFLVVIFFYCPSALSTERY